MSTTLQESPIVKPRVVVSHCLGFEACRYNGEVIKAPFLKILEPFVEYVFVCPEVEVGMGVPRDPVRLVSLSSNDEEPRMIQPQTGIDFTEKMKTFSRSFLDGLKEIDGFVLKSASPSCALKDAKLFTTVEKGPSFGRGPGLFGAAVLERFSDIAVEDEGRLMNLPLREHFLTRIFTLARFREVLKQGKVRDLVQFHSVHKLLLLAYNQKEKRILGRIVANPDRLPFREQTAVYREHLNLAMARLPRYNSNLNVLMHAFGYVSRELSKGEKAFFLDLLEQFREKKITLSTVNHVVRSWLIRFQVDYLLSQTYFEPYPDELVSLRDSGKGRDVR